MPKLKVRNLNDEIDPTFGKTDVGASFGAFGNFGFGSIYPMGTENGQAQSISWYCANKAAQTTESKMGIYNLDTTPSSRVAQAVAAVIGVGWVTGNLANEALVANVSYYLEVVVDSDPSWQTLYAYDAGSAQQMRYEADIIYANEMTDPFGTQAGTMNNAMSIYVTYTTAPPPGLPAKRRLLGVGR